MPPWPRVRWVNEGSVIGVVIVAHGGLAQEYLAAVEHVVGPLDGIKAISIAADCHRASKQAEIIAATEAVDRGEGVVVVTDMFGGSPSNLSLPACRDKKRCILYGANLPMLIKLVKSRGKDLDQAVATARDAGRKYIDMHVVAGD